MKSSLFVTPSHPPFGWESGAGVDTQHILQMLEQASIRGPMYTTGLLLF